MIECPEFDYDYEKSHAVYLWCLHVASMINLIVNPLIIYCIIYRSTNHMATYRWFLLIHQIAAFIADLWVDFPFSKNAHIKFRSIFSPKEWYLSHFLLAISLAMPSILFHQLLLLLGDKVSLFLNR